MAILVVLIVVLTLSVQRHPIACELVSYSSYSELRPNIYVSPLIDEAKVSGLLAAIREGKGRVNDTFGEMISSPKVVITANLSEASGYGSNSFGRAFLTPLGQCLVFGPNGQNVDVIAHEHVHAEVHYRVGRWKHLRSVPIWFNEGVSLLVDFRSPYLIDNITVSKKEIDDVKTMGSEFFTGDHVVRNYQAARLAVETLDRTQLYGKLRELRNGQRFDDVFDL